MRMAPPSEAILPVVRVCTKLGLRHPAKTILRAGVDETFLYGGLCPPSPGSEARVGGQSPPYIGSLGAV
jgi:hypothetical protein